jgi:hypothetical protein
LLNRGPHGPTFDWGDHRWFKSDLQLLREFLADQIGADSEFEGKLRAAALGALETDNAEYIRRAIQVLSVVGLAEDQSRISLFLDHPDADVCKDAQSCMFEMKMRLK